MFEFLETNRNRFQSEITFYLSPGATAKNITVTVSVLNSACDYKI